jgi:glucokinase
MNTKPAVVGVDVGGTKTLCVLVDKHCQPIHRIKFKTAPGDGCKEFTRHLVDSATELADVARAKGFKLAGAGVGFAGSVDRKEGRIIFSPNLLCLEGFPIGKHLTKALKVDVLLGNDVQMGISGEHKIGAARGFENVLGVFFGTGVGGAAIINNRLYCGTSGIGGQVGSILAQPVGGPKAALSHGILDRIASKAAIASEALVMAIKDWAPYLHGKVGTDLAKVTWSMLERAVRHKDERIEEMLRARMHVVGIALSNVVNFMNPDMVVLGGGLVEEMPKLVVEEVEHGLRDYCVPEVFRALKIRPATLKSDAVALGSANEALIKFVKGNK